MDMLRGEDPLGDVALHQSDEEPSASNGDHCKILAGVEVGQKVSFVFLGSIRLMVNGLQSRPDLSRHRDAML